MNDPGHRYEHVKINPGSSCTIFWFDLCYFPGSLYYSTIQEGAVWCPPVYFNFIVDILNGNITRMSGLQ